MPNLKKKNQRKYFKNEFKKDFGLEIYKII